MPNRKLDTTFTLLRSLADWQRLTKTFRFHFSKAELSFLWTIKGIPFIYILYFYITGASDTAIHIPELRVVYMYI